MTKYTVESFPFAGIVFDPGNSKTYKTGDWKSKKPVVMFEKCSKCKLCFIYCPEFCIRQQSDGFFVADLDYCKGCGICAKECPKEAITMEGV